MALGSLPTAPFNECHWDDSSYDALYQEGLRTVDETKRAEIAHEMQKIDYDSGGYIIPYFPPTIDGYVKNLHGGKTSKTGLSLNNYGFKSMWLS